MRTLALALRHYLTCGVVTTTSLPANVANIPAGIVPDNSALFGLIGLLANVDLFDNDMLAVPYAAATTLTLTAVQSTANYLDFSGSGVLTFTTATAAQIIAALPSTIPTNGFAYEQCITNDGTGQTITIAGGTGVTILGTATIANNTTRRFLVNVQVGTNVITFLNIGSMAL